jgi:ribosomal protein S18 acetylase RimI-like enzyme
MNYQFKQLQPDEIDLIQPLWEKLNLLHFEASQNFKDRFKNMSWEKRKTKLITKSEEILIDTIMDHENRIIGYCISSIDKENNKTGEIDSIYIDEAYRKCGLGKQLINNSIDWLIAKGTIEQKLLVGVGNEKVRDFYKKFNFFPLHIVLQRID